MDWLLFLLVFSPAIWLLLRMIWLLLVIAWEEWGAPVMPAMRRRRRRTTVQEGLHRYPFGAGWARAVPSDVADLITGWDGPEGEAWRTFLSTHWRMTYELPGGDDGTIRSVIELPAPATARRTWKEGGPVSSGREFEWS